MTYPFVSLDEITASIRLSESFAFFNLFNIKTSWVSEISHVSDKNYFIDEQRFGPYKLWHHKHFFKAIEGGVEITDIIDYKLPFGLLGRLVHPYIVKPKLEEIFNFRREKLTKLFGSF